jgi:acyl carrier protein
MDNGRSRTIPDFLQEIDIMNTEIAGIGDAALQAEVAELVVQSLNLDVRPEEINPDDPLYGDGLGLDSIDVLEIALVVSKRYGLQLRADSDDNHRIFSSLRSLTEYISAHRGS